jgi:hypothetical protein
MEWSTLEELPSSSLGRLRPLKGSEKALLARLSAQLGDAAPWVDRLDSLRVQDMPDDGMGSLYFASDTKVLEGRKFGRRVAELQFDDADGVVILASLNVDTVGELYELDIWRTDFKPVIRLNPP